MGLSLDQIKDPALRRKLIEADQAVNQLRRDIAKECPLPKKRRIRQDHKPLLNKLESEFETWMQMTMYADEGIACVLMPQAVRFKLANGLWYKPDFFWPERLIAYEVKGPRSFRGGFENLKMAAHQYHWIKWILVFKQDGQWTEQLVLP